MAQNINPLKDTVMYLFKNHEIQVGTQDSADYVRVTYPPVNGEELFTIKEFYRNGNPKLITHSYSNTLFPYVEGKFVEYFENGNKKSEKSFHNGYLEGDIYEYYPNGNLYTIKSLDKVYEYRLKECRDSTGNILAENGNGNWIIFFNNFKQILVKGTVKDGVRHGTWYTADGDSSMYLAQLRYGAIASKDKGKPKSIIKVLGIDNEEGIVPPSPPNGLYPMALLKIKIPQLAQKNGITGLVMVAFFVSDIGKLDDFKILFPAGFGWDEEVIKLLRSSGTWTPATKNGKNIGATYVFTIYRPLNY